MHPEPEKVEIQVEDNELWDERKPYERPMIIHEFELETRAGSPVKVDPLDPDIWN
jgi:hypothetical protein